MEKPYIQGKVSGVEKITTITKHKFTQDHYLSSNFGMSVMVWNVLPLVF